MRPKGRRNIGSNSLFRSCSYGSVNTAKIQYFKRYGVFERKKFLNDFDRHANLKYKYGNRHFWCRGYYVDTVGRNEKAIREYVKNQLQEDIANDQISIQEYVDPFTGEQVKEGKK